MFLINQKRILLKKMIKFMNKTNMKKRLKVNNQNKANESDDEK